MMIEATAVHQRTTTNDLMPSGSCGLIGRFDPAPLLPGAYLVWYHYDFWDKGRRCRATLLRSVSGNNSVVECDLAKVEVAGSNPVSRSILYRRGPLPGRRSASKIHSAKAGTPLRGAPSHSIPL